MGLALCVSQSEKEILSQLLHQSLASITEIEEQIRKKRERENGADSAHKLPVQSEQEM